MLYKKLPESMKMFMIEEMIDYIEDTANERGKTYEKLTRGDFEDFFEKVEWDYDATGDFPKLMSKANVNKMSLRFENNKVYLDVHEK